MTNGERADRLVGEALGVAGEMQRALADGRWNLAARRAQEVVELVLKGLLAEMSVDYPRSHDVAPVFVEAVHERGIEVDAGFLAWLVPLSARLADVRAPAFYQEIAVEEGEAREAVGGAERVLAFGQELVARLRQA